LTPASENTMTPTQLREWLFQHTQDDQWWISLDAVTDDRPVTVNEIEERLKYGQFRRIQALHLSQAGLANPPWIEIELPAPPQQSVASVTPQLPTLPSASPKTALACHTCGQGSLMKRKKYRMSGPVVLIGYIMLIPSVIGMLIGVLLLFASGSASTAVSSAADKETRTRLVAQAIPEPIIEKVVSSQTITTDDRSTLTPAQRSVVDDATLSLSVGKVGAGAGAVIGGGLSILLIICCFVGGLLGWLLIMKKKVLQCTHCSAIVAAS